MDITSEFRRKCIFRPPGVLLKVSTLKTEIKNIDFKDIAFEVVIQSYRKYVIILN